MGNRFTSIIVAIAFEVSNGLLGMKRDVILRLCILMRFKDKNIRSTLSISQEQLVWRNHRYFVTCRMKQCVPIVCTTSFLPKIAGEGVTYFGSKVTFAKAIEGCVSLAQDLSARTIFSLDAAVKSHGGVGIALDSLLVSLYSSSLYDKNGSSMLFASGGVFVDGREVYDFPGDRTYNGKAYKLRLELNQHAHTLHFFVDDHQISCLVTKVPTNVRFMLSHINFSFQHSLRVCSLRAIQSPTADPSVVSTKVVWGWDEKMIE